MYLRNHKNIRPSLDHLIANDRYFKKTFKLQDIETIEHRKRACSFEAFARTIVGQQLSTKAAATIWGRATTLIDPFTPENAMKKKDAQLRGVGLSGQKVNYMRGLCDAVMSGEFNPAKLRYMDDAEVVETITALKGFGQWSAEMVLMSALVRPDVFSGGDLGLREGIKRVMNLKERPTEKESVKLAERWAGHRTAASLLLWHSIKMDQI